MFSNRLNWEATTNRLFEARQKHAARGAPLFDLTESNPTRVGLPYPTVELQEIFARAACAPYEPHPLGLPSAREALAEWLSRDSTTVSPDQIVLTASTSEAYSYLFKLLTNPGDAVVTAVPSYPLLDHLAALEAVRLRHFGLLFHRRWTVEAEEVEQEIDGERARAIVAVHPNNPTGSFLTRSEQDDLARVCGRRDLALISDEVFADYRWSDELDIAPAAAHRDDVLCFSLGGLSKSAGLPHWKLGWICLGGPRAMRQRALAALELIADSYLSVTTAIQRALPELLPFASSIQGLIRDRVRTNLSRLRETVGGTRKLNLLPVEGGWSAVLRMPAVIPDDEFAIELLEDESVLIHPGYFFDFPGEGFLVISLLPSEEGFAEGVKRLTAHVEGRVR